MAPAVETSRRAHTGLGISLDASPTHTRLWDPAQLYSRSQRLSFGIYQGFFGWAWGSAKMPEMKAFGQNETPAHGSLQLPCRG